MDATNPARAPHACPAIALAAHACAPWCRGSADAEEYASAAHAAVGASIAAQGPRAVLAVVPVDLSDLSTCDTWIIPLLRKHTAGTEMAFWGEYMLPRARMIGSLAARAQHLGAPLPWLCTCHRNRSLWLSSWCPAAAADTVRGTRQLRLLRAWPFPSSYLRGRGRAAWGCSGAAMVCAGAAGHGADHIKLAALEMQLWGTLASFARWAVDVPAALSGFGETLGAAFSRRPDLQAAICNVLRRVCGDTCAALRAFGVEDGAGFGDAAEEGGEGAGGDAASSVFAVRVGAGPEEVPGTFTEEMALANRDAVRGVAQKWLTELLNRYVKLAPESRGAVGEAVMAVAAVAGEAVAGPFFKEALSKVIASLQAIQVRCHPSRVWPTATCTLACPSSFRDGAPGNTASALPLPWRAERQRAGLVFRTAELRAGRRGMLQRGRRVRAGG